MVPRPLPVAGIPRGGDYAGCLERWWSVFPRERLLVLSLDEIAARPGEVLASLARHLGIDEGDFRSLPSAALHETITPGLGKTGDDAEAVVIRAPLRPSLLEPLLELHGQDIVRLERLLGREFPAWRSMPAHGEGSADTRS